MLPHQLVWVLQAAQKDMGECPLEYFIAVTSYFQEYTQVQNIRQMVARLMQHDQQKRPSASKLLNVLQCLGAQE